MKMMPTVASVNTMDVSTRKEPPPCSFPCLPTCPRLRCPTLYRKAPLTTNGSAAACAGLTDAIKGRRDRKVTTEEKFRDCRSLFCTGLETGSSGVGGRRATNKINAAFGGLGELPKAVFFFVRRPEFDGFRRACRRAGRRRRGRRPRRRVRSRCERQQSRRKFNGGAAQSRGESRRRPFHAPLRRQA